MGKLKLPKLWIEYEVRDKDGKLVEKGKVKSQSWVGNIVSLISAMLSMWHATAGAYYQTDFSRLDLIDIGNITRGMSLGMGKGGTSGIYLGGSAPVGITDGGIVVGSNDAPVTLAQYVLQAPIAHGTGSGQLQYGATTVDPIVKDTTWTVRMIRTFTNGSGATVTVREFGIYYRFGYTPAPYYFTVMLARDVPVTAISVPAGSTLTLRYIISHSLS